MRILLQEARQRFERGYSVFVILITQGLLCFGVAFSQDATKTAPRAYQLQFENEWVRVTRVHYGPREKIPAHAHPKWPVAYVYLNDSGPIIFRHRGWDHPELTRPATKAGSIRLSPTSAINEVHEVENPNDAPSDFLRVEFKTQPVGRVSRQGRFHREDYPTGENFRRVQFENEQIRMTRLICAPHRVLDAAAGSSEPALFIVLSPARSTAKETTLEPGQTIWTAQSQSKRFENLGDTPLELLRFDLKTGPQRN